MRTVKILSYMSLNNKYDGKNGMNKIFFFIGTEAELIKLFPIMLELKHRSIDYKVISSGQNNIKSSVIFEKTHSGMVDLELSDENSIKKNAIGLLAWWIKTYHKSFKQIKQAFPYESYADSFMIVHGDTVSTYMGARIGKKLGMTVCHVEAGLRSHNIFNPFPEEIDRLLTSRMARIHFAPGDLSVNNLKKVKGCVIDTKQNTLLDSLRVSCEVNETKDINQVIASYKPYFVFVMHRQENVANEKMLIKAVENVLSISKKQYCIFILHTITKNALERLNVLNKLQEASNVLLLPRVDYFSFMKLLNNAEFVMTDGGSNQEELYYMGKPTLILRNTTERNEGIGENAILFSDIDDMNWFAESYQKYKIRPHISASPSCIIADYLELSCCKR